MRKEIIDSVLKEKLIVIVRAMPEDKLISFAEAVYAGGIRLLELTFSATGAWSDEDTANRIASLVKHFEGRMHIGAGTVLNEKQVELVKQAGGEYIISPNTNPAVIRKTVELGMVSIPGALTPTEVQIAHEAGADFVKLFPASAMGPSYIKAISAPLSHIKFLATGGVSEKNLAEFLQAGAVGAGVGGNMTKKELVDAENWEEITRLAKAYTDQL